ncbi:hypothetical protein [Streptomyces sp. NPDC006140]|uniref:hypothetical protein n=1 Tax=Streptomyces sp. NPDC006140 TaxID=3154579 RepID=UPI003409AF98
MGSAAATGDSGNTGGRFGSSDGAGSLGSAADTEDSGNTDPVSRSCFERAGGGDGRSGDRDGADAAGASADAGADTFARAAPRPPLITWPTTPAARAPRSLTLRSPSARSPTART